MGLAASQARFLAITSRKMNCEFQSMQIAQEKLSVTRDLQAASQKYQNSLNATKLVWDTDADEVYDLSYDIMMNPSALNDYNPYLITDTQGKLVLSEKMFQAAVTAGIIDKNGDPIQGASLFTEGAADAKGDGSRNAFLNALGERGQVSQSTIDSITKLENSYTKSGVGGDILDKTIANALTSTAFISELKSKYDKTEEGHEAGDLKYQLDLISLLGDKDGNGEVTDDEISSTFCFTTSPDPEKDKGKFIITNNGQALTKDQLQNLSLGDILSGKYAMTVVGTQDLAPTSEKALYEMAKLLGYESGSSVPNGVGLNVDSEAADALSQAISFTLLNITGPDAKAVTTGGNTYEAITNAANESQNYNGIVISDKQHASISLTNLLKSYLTNFAIAIDGFSNTQFMVSDKVSDSVFATDDLNYTFLIEEKDAITESDVLTADFYNQLYNQLCMNGATSDAIKREKVTDPEYLSQAIKNGQLFISSLNTDGYFYQGAYTLNGYVAEVADEDAIAQAEAEYETTKAKLDYKEQTLELKMKNIDTELSALTTEYDTVKNLINKNVEKVFTMFST